MSNELEYYAGTDDYPLALYLQDNDAEALTDILVEALQDALRILAEDVGIDTVH